jgi:hypothetical protein
LGGDILSSLASLEFAGGKTGQEEPSRPFLAPTDHANGGRHCRQAKKKYSAIHFLKRRDYVKNCMHQKA